MAACSQSIIYLLSKDIFFFKNVYKFRYYAATSAKMNDLLKKYRSNA